MEDTRSELHKMTNDIYEKLDSRGARKIWVAAVCVSVVLDILLFLCKKSEIFLKYEKGTIVAITVVIWTFTMSFFVYCLGKIDQRHYGIHMIDIFVRGLSTRKIYYIACVTFAEIVLLIVVSALGLTVTLFALAVFQCYMMLYVILMVLGRTSEEFVLTQIREEIKDTYQIECAEHKNYFRNAGIFGQMIHNIDGDSYEEMGKLLDILRFYDHNLEQQIEDEANVGVKKYINKCSYEIAKRIYMNREGAAPVRKVMEDWFGEDDLCLEIKQGILMYMVEVWAGTRNYRGIERILDTEVKHCRELYIWVLVYNIYLQGFEGEAWRERYTSYLAHKMFFGEGKSDRNLAVNYWKQITNAEDLYDLFQYIF